MDKEILLELLGVGKEHTDEEYRQNFLKMIFRLVSGPVIRIMKTATAIIDFFFSCYHTPFIPWISIHTITNEPLDILSAIKSHSKLIKLNKINCRGDVFGNCSTIVLNMVHFILI